MTPKREFLDYIADIQEASQNITQFIAGMTWAQKVPWKEMAGMRDKLIHEYFGVNYQVLWKTAQEDIPPVQRLIEKVLKKESDRGRSSR